MARSVAKWTANLTTADQLTPEDHFRWRTTQKGVSVVVGVKRLDNGNLRVKTKDGADREVDPGRPVVLYVEPNPGATS